MDNWYQILGVQEQATDAQIKAAYRKLAKENHPDSHPGDAVREKRFKEASEAYSILSDQEKRKAYDAGRQGAAGSAGDSKTAKKRQPDYQKPDLDFQDFSDIERSFENFFGFNSKTKEIVNEDKLRMKNRRGNPLDASDLFEKFMGIKR